MGDNEGGMGQFSSRWDVTALDWASVDVSEKTIWIFVRVQLGSGITGYGEATRFGAEEAVLAELALARGLIVGKGLRAPGGVLAALRMAHASEARTAVASGIEQALLDAHARQAGMSVAQMLGGPFRTVVPAYANINRGTLDRSPLGFAKRAESIVRSHSYDALKIAPFDGLNWSHAGTNAPRLLQDGIDRILAVRDAIGPTRRLMVDCHWRLTPVMALEVLRATRDANLFWLEDALDEAAFDGFQLRALRTAANNVGVRIAGGEKLMTLAGMRNHLALGSCDVVLPDLRLTGVRQGIAMLELAASSGIEVSIHNPVGPVLDAISLQVSAALPTFLILEGQVGESPRFDDITGGRASLIDGARQVPVDPGSGPIPNLDFDHRTAVRRAATFAGMTGAGPDG